MIQKAKQPATHWWLRKPKYVGIFLREAGSFFILAYVVIFTLAALRAHDGVEAYNSFMSMVNSPLITPLSIVIFVFAIYHSLTWFGLSAKVQPLRIGKKVISTLEAILINSVILIGASFLVVNLILGA